MIPKRYLLYSTLRLPFINSIASNFALKMKSYRLTKYAKILKISNIKQILSNSKSRPRPVSLSLDDTLSHSINFGLKRLLIIGDKNSMQFSIESRQPYIDYRLMEFLATVPEIYKMHNGWTKFIARLAFDGKLPNEIVWRKDKLGYPDPDQIWLMQNRNGCKDWADHQIITHSMFYDIDKDNLEIIFRRNFGMYIRLLSTAVWKKAFFK